MKKTLGALGTAALAAFLITGCGPAHHHKSPDTAKKITGPVALTAHVHMEWAFDPSVNQPNADQANFDGKFFVQDKSGATLLSKKVSGVIIPHAAHDWYFHLSAAKVARMTDGQLNVSTDSDAPLDCTVTWNPGGNSVEAIGSYSGLAPSQDGCSVSNP